MSDDLERRLREAGHRLPGPTDRETRLARTRILAARPRGRRRSLVAALLAVAVVAGAFGAGYAVAGGKTATRTVVVRPRLEAGPGFLPDPGWTIRGTTATSGNGARIDARFSPASDHPGWPQRLLPLQLPAGGHLRAHVGAYAVEVTISLPSHDAAVLSAVRDELGRLVVPSCPTALPLRKHSAGAAAAYVRAWLPAHYPGRPSDAVGADAKGRAGTAMPRYGEAVADCGKTVAARSVEVDVVLPRIAKVSASLSQLTYFVAQTPRGWTVWERAR